MRPTVKVSAMQLPSSHEALTGYQVIRAELNKLGLHFSQKSEDSARTKLGFKYAIFHTGNHLVKIST